MTQLEAKESRTVKVDSKFYFSLFIMIFSCMAARPIFAQSSRCLNQQTLELDGHGYKQAYQIQKNPLKIVRKTGLYQRFIFNFANKQGSIESTRKTGGVAFPNEREWLLEQEMRRLSFFGIEALRKEALRCQKYGEDILDSALKKPLSEIEVGACSESLKKVQALEKCKEAADCREYFLKTKKLAKEKKFSFKKLFSGTNGILNNKETVGIWALTWAGELSYVYVIGKLVKESSRASFRTIGGIASWVAYFAIKHLIKISRSKYCEDVDLRTLNQKTKKCIDSLKGRLSNSLLNPHNTALEDPERFFIEAKKPKNGLYAHVVCLSLEETAAHFDTLSSEISCQGKTFWIGGESYILDKNWVLRNHIDGQTTHYFDLKRRQAPYLLRGQKKITVDKAPRRLMAEYQVINALTSEIKRKALECNKDYFYPGDSDADFGETVQ